MTLAVYFIGLADSASYPCLSSAVYARYLIIPADDHLDNDYDQHQHVIKHSAATYFFVRVEDDSMVGNGIHRLFVTSCGFGLIEQAAHRTANQIDHGDEVGLVPVATCP